VNTKNAQGAAGFLGKVGSLRLKDISLSMENDYGSVTVVSLDGKPISTSSKILIQAMTIEQLHGFQATGPGNLSGRIQKVGSAPWGVEKYRAEVTFRLRGERPPRVVACDEHGYPTEKPVQVSREEEVFKVTLNPTSPYHVVLR
jgi:hypothetical protein